MRATTQYNIMHEGLANVSWAAILCCWASNSSDLFEEFPWASASASAEREREGWKFFIKWTNINHLFGQLPLLLSECLQYCDISICLVVVRFSSFRIGDWLKITSAWGHHIFYCIPTSIPHLSSRGIQDIYLKVRNCNFPRWIVSWSTGFELYIHIASFTAKFTVGLVSIIYPRRSNEIYGPGTKHPNYKNRFIYRFLQVSKKKIYQILKCYSWKILGGISSI